MSAAEDTYSELVRRMHGAKIGKVSGERQVVRGSLPDFNQSLRVGQSFEVDSPWLLSILSIQVIVYKIYLSVAGQCQYVIAI